VCVYVLSWFTFLIVGCSLTRFLLLLLSTSINIWFLGLRSMHGQLSVKDLINYYVGGASHHSPYANILEDRYSWTGIGWKRSCIKLLVVRLAVNDLVD